MVLALDTHWIWDSWYAHDGERWHGYFLKAPKSLGDPQLRHRNARHGHAVSDDLVSWTHLGTCLEPSGGPGWDDCTTWTGSVLQGPDGTWHLFYTGASQAEDGLYQRIGHAVSTDMHSWKRVGEAPCLDLAGPHAASYEASFEDGLWHDRAMRDPWVMADPDGDGWLMFFTARAAGVMEPNAGGAIGFATSPDLFDWVLEPPVFVGGYGQLEVPQVFEQGGRWYCLFCTAAEHFSKDQAETHPGGPVSGSHYLIGESPRGPWRIAPGHFLDGALPCRRYAARILKTDAGLKIIGFADHPAGHFVGEVTNPDPVEIDADGMLRVQGAQLAAE
ncbi:MAG TPA: levansucrase [Amaricoccus sp.]|uniref:levansucrase n=1 Tax=Amaricoccus sp. TaxID=1872485 RepID=UPI002C8BB20C|nr:levansucrase [Amaricoccus sp.]HMQ93980.1 levansucrase [Amaricoccus sp.]HMR52836.1 levansucrase [Amaricoccus sp.]HMR60810.1 levansucrase [Amaricoccus sp.]HMT99771.1 levansucrase [Amaricoccus sp.]